MGGLSCADQHRRIHSTASFSCLSSSASSTPSSIPILRKMTSSRMFAGRDSSSPTHSMCVYHSSRRNDAASFPTCTGPIRRVQFAAFRQTYIVITHQHATNALLNITPFCNLFESNFFLFRHFSNIGLLSTYVKIGRTVLSLSYLNILTSSTPFLFCLCQVGTVQRLRNRATLISKLSNN